jgi:hypothetical protein
VHGVLADPYAAEEGKYEGMTRWQIEEAKKKETEANEDKNPVVRILKGVDRNMGKQLPLLRDIADTLNTIQVQDAD